LCEAAQYEQRERSQAEFTLQFTSLLSLDLANKLKGNYRSQRRDYASEL
jgi:hypothetical protein